LKASDLLVQCLENERVEYVFGLPGEETLDVLDSLHASRIKFIPVRHEQGAAFMADVYGRLTGRAGVCLSTLGPGSANLVTGIADAYLDRAPLVAITGQAGLDRIHKESHQYIDVVGMFHSITKWNARVEKAALIPEIVRKAFKIAQTEKPGACHIELPEDVAAEETKGKPFPVIPVRRPSPDRTALKAVAKLTEESERPIVLAGNGVIRGKAAGELHAFSQKTGIPVANTFMGKGVIPWDSELSLLTIGLQAHDYVSFGFDRADLIIAVGYDIVEYDPKFWNPGGDKKIIHIDFTPSEIDSHYKTAVEIVADIRETLELLGKEIRRPKERTELKALRSTIMNEFTEYAQDPGFPMKPQRILHDIHSFMAEDDLVISDVGAHKIWIARMYPVSRPNTCIISNGFAAMGIALPGAIAAKLVYPDRRVLAICGDGGFLMNAQEMETACRLNVPFVALIFRDDGYGLIEWKQIKKFGRKTGVDFGNPDFVKFAESFGAKGYRVEKASQLIPTLEQAFKQSKPSVIDLPVDYRENLKLTERLGQIICPI
jgi:acetolactate synthase-1/2/3 large subunit